ncbi:MAG: aldo/keto reductase [Sphaerochaetaceae bacterium]|nr:aldo/keto reductase [Spirochaetales bacterium]MDY5500823.1 aldo/keto reductase [Sphaerochaetaceae bacterium]
MKYKVLGRTGVKVSQLGLGCMNFANGVDETMAKKIIDRCRDKGVNLFDTANIYGLNRCGESEEILGKCLEGQRDECIIISKVGNSRWNRPDNDGGLSRRYIMLEVEKSLKRLKTDRIDIYMIHHMDPCTPIEETLRALDDLQRQGKIIYAGISNASAWEIALSLGISERECLGRFEAVEPMYNLVKRQSEVEILPLAMNQNLGVVTYSPLGAGLLTGKYKGGNLNVEGRITKSARYSGRYIDEQNFKVADAFVDYAEAHGLKPTPLAIAWVMSNPAVTCPLIGAKNLEQLELALAAVDIQMTTEMRSEITALSVEPPSATDRTEEKKNPNIFGH